MARRLKHVSASVQQGFSPEVGCGGGATVGERDARRARTVSHCTGWPSTPDDVYQHAWHAAHAQAV